jgi:hypothetical protein
MRFNAAAKKFLDDLPFTADIYWLFRQSQTSPTKTFYLNKLEDALPNWINQATKSEHFSQPGKKVLIFAALHYWISHAALLGTALCGLGHKVVLAYLPYARWQEPINQFDLRRQNLYARGVLNKGAPILKSVSLLDVKNARNHLPLPLTEAVEEISLRDTQYTLQVEEIDQHSHLFNLRIERNTKAASTALSMLDANPPEVVIIPNGSILEMGIMYRVARYLGIPTISYEFGEQRNRIWLAQNKEVMRQETDDLWEVYKDRPLSEDQLGLVRGLFGSRQKADLWKNFSRRWQVLPNQGGDQVHQSLGLDSRPVVLLAANVIGDSLTLGRQFFSRNMTEWLKRTVRYFSKKPMLQLIVRIHPGERYTKGPSVAALVKQTLPVIPENIHLISADDQINTYDLLKFSDLGLVYTTTVGLELSMSGIPVVVSGITHYRDKGFTLDPSSWEEYFNILDNFAQDPQRYRLTSEQVDISWRYAFRFFFDYPAPFPWPMPRFWKELETWPIERVLSKEGLAQYGDTFRYLVGVSRDWSFS